MADQILFDDGGFNDSVRRFRTEHAQILTIGGDVRNLMNQMGGAWTGQASAAFQDVYALWNKGFVESADILAEINNTLTQAGSQAVETESGLVGVIGGGTDL